ncbi:hypothetical protein CO641_02150 [Lysobacteraceae bacterium NML91-0213]|nr:hypothetical protein CO641_02150 [Xanthomonadaceae bacterium NML91-0213]
MGRKRTKNLDLPRRLSRDPRSEKLRYKRPDNDRYVYLSTHPEEVAIRFAELANTAFGDTAPRGLKTHYRTRFRAFDWSGVDQELLDVVAMKLHDILPMQKGLAVQEQIRHSWAYQPPPAAALRHGLRTQSREIDACVPQLFASAKKNAKVRGLEFILTVEDVRHLVTESRGLCAVTGIAMSVDRGALPAGRKMRRPWAPSIDRLDSSMGYTLSNCRIVCCAANYAMSQWGEDVLVEMAKAIARRRIARLDRVASGLP